MEGIDEILDLLEFMCLFCCLAATLVGVVTLSKSDFTKYSNVDSSNITLSANNGMYSKLDIDDDLLNTDELVITLLTQNANMESAEDEPNHLSSLSELLSEYADSVDSSHTTKQNRFVTSYPSNSDLIVSDSYSYLYKFQTSYSMTNASYYKKILNNKVAYTKDKIFKILPAKYDGNLISASKKSYWYNVYALYQYDSSTNKLNLIKE